MCTASIYNFMHYLHNSVDDECIHTPNSEYRWILYLAALCIFVSNHMASPPSGAAVLNL